MSESIRKLTNSTDETELSDLFSRDLAFGIPYFQRAYKWSEKNILRFETDLENLLDYEDTSHFLGAIIVFGKDTNPSDSKYYEVIDGQQRLTTCFLSLIALAKVFTMYDMIDEAISLYQRFLIINHPTTFITNAKLICCKEDRAGINNVFHDLMANSTFSLMINERRVLYKPMPNTGNPNGRIWKNYVLLRKFFDRIYKENENVNESQGKNMLKKIYEKLVFSMSVVQIVVKDPTDGPKIFDSLNSKQEPMTIGDLVRNELFSKYANCNDDEIDILDRDYWHPFYEKFNQKHNDENFDKVFEQFFFPYVLILNHTTKKADAFNYLRSKWANEDNPKTIIESLSKYQNIFLDLNYGTKLSNCQENIQNAIYRLSRIEAPTSVYPFIMQVVCAVQDNVIDSQTAEQILVRIESFLIRRAVCGYEPTGLHAAFKSLWYDCEGNYSVENVLANIAKHQTVKWPDDEEFSRNLKERPLYKVRVTPYILSEWNSNLGGDLPELDSQQIEHVLPENPDKASQWNIDWTQAEQEKYKNCLANLLPISGSLNASIQNSDYEKKRERYQFDSALKAPRIFAQKYQKWTPAEYIIQSNELVTWALNRWKY